LIDATPVPCGQSRQTVKRSEFAGYAAYGYCAAHSRHFWGFKLYLPAAPDGMPIAFELAPANVPEREVVAEMLEALDLTGYTVIGDKGLSGAAIEELVRRRSWPNRRELQSAVFDYIETFYNRERRHSTLGYLSPRVRDDLNSPTKRDRESQALTCRPNRGKTRPQKPPSVKSTAPACPAASRRAHSRSSPVLGPTRS
jgi:hypothetical protein